MQTPKLGVVIVTFNSEDTIKACLDSLFATPTDQIRVVVVDNASTDQTGAVVERSFAERPDLNLLLSSQNRGFAAGVNIGLRTLMQDPEVTHIWLLNPDCQLAPTTLSGTLRYLEKTPEAHMVGGRVAYLEHPEMIQSDGARLNKRSGRSANLHQHLDTETCPPPDWGQIDFVSGASLLVSRRFVKSVGLMNEDYFLFYEEADWTLRGNNFPIKYCPEMLVYHAAGSSIGSAKPGHVASALSEYHLHRSRMGFVRRYFPQNVKWALGFGLAKAARWALAGYPGQAQAALCGTLGLHRPRAARAPEPQLFRPGRTSSAKPSMPLQSGVAPSNSQTTRAPS